MKTQKKKRNRSWFCQVSGTKYVYARCGMFYVKGGENNQLWLFDNYFWPFRRIAPCVYCLHTWACRGTRECLIRGGVNARKDTSALPTFASSALSQLFWYLQIRPRQLRQSSIKQKGEIAWSRRRKSSGSPGLDTRTKTSLYRRIDRTD